MPAMPSIVKNDPWWFADPHRTAYTTQALLGPTMPTFWAFNPAYAQVQNEHVLADGVGRHHARRDDAAGGRRQGVQAGRGDLREIPDRAELRADAGATLKVAAVRSTRLSEQGGDEMTTLTRRSVLRSSAARGGGTVGAALYRQRGGHDRDRVVGPGLRARGGHRVQEDRRRLREGQRQHDRLQHHPLCAAAPEDHLGGDERRGPGSVPEQPGRDHCAVRLGRQAGRCQRRRRDAKGGIHRDRAAHRLLLQQRREKTQLLRCALYRRRCRPNHIWRPLVEKAGYKMEDIPKTWDAFYDFFKEVQKKLRAQGDAQRLWPRFPVDHQRRRSATRCSTIS